MCLGVVFEAATLSAVDKEVEVGSVNLCICVSVLIVLIIILVIVLIICIICCLCCR